ncbi:MAG: hypothetical protein HY855_08395 [Burkholderiales bacterium]|nr:hypothetical protein [Burkholderiales bacterium]
MKFAVQLDRFIGACAVVSVVDPVFRVPEKCVVLATVAATARPIPSVHFQRDLHGIRHIAVNNVNELMLNIGIDSGRPRLPIEK